MKNYRKFNDVLEECLERLLSREETLEQCLQSYPEHADELRPLLKTALVTKEVSAIQPRPEFREKARYQFYSALQEMERKKKRSFFKWSWQPQWAMAIAAVLIIFMAGGGTVAASANSMPDEPLYPVKIASEQVQLAFTFSRLGKAEVYARLTDRRVNEIVDMADKGKPEQIEQATRRLDTYLAKITDLASASNAVMVMQAPPAEEAAATVEEPGEAPLLEKAPAVAPAPPKAEEKPAGGGQVVREREGVEKGPEIDEAPTTREAQFKNADKAKVSVNRQAELKNVVAQDAIENSQQLRAVLRKVPESARPALLKAISLSESGYKKAIESLDQP